MNHLLALLYKECQKEPSQQSLANLYKVTQRVGKKLFVKWNTTGSWSFSKELIDVVCTRPQSFIPLPDGFFYPSIGTLYFRLLFESGAQWWIFDEFSNVLEVTIK